MINLRKNSYKKNYTHFLLDGDFLVFRWLTYIFEKAKGLRICKAIHIFIVKTENLENAISRP